MGHLIIKIILTGVALWVLVHHESWACSYSTGDPLRVQKSECETRAGSRWSCDLNRCVATKEALSIQQTSKECDGLEDGERAKDCRIETAKEAVKDQGIDLDDDDLGRHRWGQAAAQGVQGAIGSYYALMGFLKKDRACPYSGTFLNLGALASIGGSLAAFYTQKKESGELLEEYTQLVNSERPVAGQIEAFDYLIKGQEELASAANGFKLANYAASGLFAAAAIQGLWGVINGGGFMCGAGAGSSSETRFSLSLFPEAFAAESEMGGYGRILGFSAPGAVTGGLAAFLSRVEKSNTPPALNRFLSSPGGRMIVATIASSLALYSARRYEEEKRLALERAEEIRELRDAFAGRMGYDSCPDRNNPSNPECYCFIRPNILNPDRKSSSVCKKYILSSEEGGGQGPQEASGTEEKAPFGCVGPQGNFDLSCDCLQGRNRCQSASLGAGQLGFSGLNPTVANLTRGARNLFSGSGAEASFDGEATGQGAAKLRRALAQALKDKRLKKTKEGKRILKALDGFNSRKGLRMINQALGPRGRALADSFKGAGVSVPELPPEHKLPKDILEKWKSSNGLLGRIGKSSKKKSSPSINALLGLGRQKNRSPSQEEKKNQGGDEYDHSGSDVHSEDHSLWKIISHRYNQTGFFRLFNE